MNICVVGAFGFEDLANTTGGQPVKTRELYYALKSKYGADEVSFVETYRWKRNPLKMLASLMRHVPHSEAVIMLPAHNGLKVFARLLQTLKNKKAKLFYDVIGGWLPTVAEKDPKLISCLKKLDGIWVETSSMQRDLEKLGLEQVTVVPNFKTLDVLTPAELVYADCQPYRLCTFSRVMEEKGITDAIEAVHRVNTQLGETVYTLDIYGPVAPQYEETFQKLQAQHGDWLSYRGVKDPSQSVQTLKDYYALLFPTKFYTEGIPGTIIDAYAAGVPVITARWLNCADVLDDGVTGIGYIFGQQQELEQILLRTAERPEILLNMKQDCLKKAGQYMPATAMEQIFSAFRGGDEE